MDVASSVSSPQLPEATKSTSGIGSGVQLSNQGVPLHKGSSKQQEVYRKKGNFPEEKQKIIAHASRISNNNLDFIATLDKENAGTWEVNVKNYNENGSYDKGICQYNSTYFAYKYRDRQWTNPEWQVNECYQSYTTWEKQGLIAKRFFAYPKRHESKKNFELVVQ